MALRLKIPYTSLVYRANYNSSTGQFGPYSLWSNSSGQVQPLIKDERPLAIRSRFGKGWHPPKPYFRKVMDSGCTAPSLFADYEKWNGSGKDRSIHAGPASAESYVDTNPPVPLGIQAKCEAGALRKLKAQNVNYSVAIGERHQTAQLVTQTLGRLTRAVVAAKRGSVRELTHALGLSTRGSRSPRKVISDARAFNLWLEYQYGWKPLLSDVHGAIKDLNEREKQAGRTMVTVKSGFTSRDSSSVPVTLSCVSDYYDYKASIRDECRCFVRLDYVRQDAPWSTLSQLGITNPLSVAWELVPWSFVADWFAPIGSYLDLLDADLGWSLRGGSCSIKSTRKIVHSGGGIRSTSGWPVASGGAYVTGKGRSMVFTRTTYSSSPFPDLSYLTTKFGQASNQHVANGIALLMSRIVVGRR